MSDLTYSDVVRILGLIDRSEGLDIELCTGPFGVKVRRAGTGVTRPTAQVPAPAVPSAPPRTAESATAQAVFPDAMAIAAPMAGVFYASPAPGKPPFVALGQQVIAGDQLGIIEVMKLFTALTATTDGIVVAVLVEDQQSVAKDEVLMLIDSGPDSRAKTA